jgi:hypothetical protein
MNLSAGFNSQYLCRFVEERRKSREREGEREQRERERESQVKIIAGPTQRDWQNETDTEM